MCVCRRATTRLIHRRRGHCCQRRLRLRSHDDGADEDGRSERQDRHADIRGREEVGHHNPICPYTCRQLSWALLCADATHMSRLTQDLSMSSTPRRPQSDI